MAPAPQLTAELLVVPSALSPTQGSANTFYAILRDTLGTVTPGVSAAWSSSDTTRVRVNSFGRALFVGAGAATLTATVGPLTATAAVNVAGVTVMPVQLAVTGIRVTNVPSRWLFRFPAAPLYTGDYVLDLLGGADTTVVGRALCTAGTP